MNIFKKFGGEQAVWDFLQSDGFSKENISMMKSRGNLSGPAKLSIASECSRRGIPVDKDRDFYDIPSNDGPEAA